LLFDGQDSMRKNFKFDIPDAAVSILERKVIASSFLFEFYANQYQGGKKHLQQDFSVCLLEDPQILLHFFSGVKASVKRNLKLSNH
jgi:hypothetical protein